jgi:excisionase family DNA binding protein
MLYCFCHKQRESSIFMLTVAQTAAQLGVTPERVRAMINSGVLPATKFGKSWVITEKAVAERLFSKPKAGRPKKPDKEVLGKSGNAHQESYDVKDMRKLFEQCKEQLAGCYDAAFLLQAASEEERHFYTTVADFFLQQKQRAVRALGVGLRSPSQPPPGA